MLRLATVLLHHTTACGSHYDWLLDPPPSVPTPHAQKPDPPLLVTGRVIWDSSLWVQAGTWTVQMIGDHRRAYLRYEGALSRRRGIVRRVDSGWYVPLLWGSDRRVIDLAMTRCGARVELVRLTTDRWRAVTVT